MKILRSGLPCRYLIERAPGFAAHGFGQARVDQRPAVAIVHEPDVDVIQLHRQRDTPPPEAFADLAGMAGRGWIGVEVVERVPWRRIQLAFPRDRAAMFGHCRPILRAAGPALRQPGRQR